MSKGARNKKRGKTVKSRKSAIEVQTQTAMFLTIDLEVRSRRSLAPLVTAWPRAYEPQTGKDGGPDSRWLIMNAFIRPGDTAETAAKKLLSEIAKLKAKALTSWKHAHQRTFDIGVQAASQGSAFEEVRLSADTLKRIARVGGQIQLTVYPADRNRPATAPR